MRNSFTTTLNNSKRGKIIAFVHHKGGTGKTTSCLNVAGWLVKMGKKVLVVDLDPQGNSTAGLGVDRSTLEGSLYDVLRSEKFFKEVIVETLSGVHVAPSTADLLSADMEMAGRMDQVSILDERLKEIAILYDYILIDVPPGSTMLMMNGIAAAEDLIIPMDSGVFACEALDTLKTIVINLSNTLGVKVNVFMILVKGFSNDFLDRSVSQEVFKMVKTFFSSNDLAHVPIVPIPFSRQIYGAQMKGLPISHWAPHSNVGKVYRNIAKEVLNSCHRDTWGHSETILKNEIAKSLS